MTKQEQILDLARQVKEAGAAGDAATVRRLTGELDALTHPASFSEEWGFNGSPEKKSGQFEKTWGFIPQKKG